MKNRLALVHESVFSVDRTPQLLLILCVISIGLWAAFVEVAVPMVIESAYRGESFSFLNRIIEGQSFESVDFYLQQWNKVAVTGYVAWLGFWLLSLMTTSGAFFRKFVGEATPGTLGAIRMWTCAVLLAITLWDDLASLALLPPEYRMSMGLMDLLHVGSLGSVFDSFLASEMALSLFQRVTELGLFLGMIGWRTRFIMPLATALAFVFNGILRQYSGFWHQGLVPIYVMAILCFTPCGAGFSVDRLRRIFRGQAVPDSRATSATYGWARYLCWSAIAITYSAAGLSKLRAAGLDWMSASSVRGHLYEQTLYPRGSNFSISLQLASAPDIVFVLLGVAAICGEVFFALVLFSRHARRIMPATIILMHVGIILLQNIVFLDFMLMLLIFYDFSMVVNKVGARLRRSGLVQVLYDGTCPLCQRTVRVLGAMDLFHRMEFVDFRRLNLLGYNQKHGTNLAPAMLENQMFAIWNGRTYGGFEAYRLMAISIPALWPLVPLLFVPSVPAIGKSVYAYVARHRLALVKCNSECAVESDASERRQRLSIMKLRQTLAYPVGAAALITVMGTCWARAFEYYPFTDMHMFSNVKKSVTYYKVLGHWRSGQVSTFQLENTLGAMSINSRYEMLFDLCFGSNERQLALCKKTLGIMMSAYNRKATSDKMLADLEIQRWTWDYMSNPKDPNYGSLDARYVAGLAGVERAPKLESRELETPAPRK